MAAPCIIWQRFEFDPNATSGSTDESDSDFTPTLDSGTSCNISSHDASGSGLSSSCASKMRGTVPVPKFTNTSLRSLSLQIFHSGSDSSDQSEDMPLLRQLASEFDMCTSTESSQSQSSHRVGRPQTSSSRKSRRARAAYARKKTQDEKPTQVLASSVERRARRCAVQTVKKSQAAFARGDFHEGCELQVASIATKAGRKAFPQLSALFDHQSVHAAVGEAVLCENGGLGQVGKCHRLPLVRMCTQNMNAEQKEVFSKLSGLSSAYVRSAVWSDRGRSSSLQQPTLFTDQYTSRSRTTQPSLPRSARKKLTPAPGLEKLVVDFFIDITDIKSGAECVFTRLLGLGMAELQVEFYANYPRLLRSLNCFCPSLLDQASDKAARKNVNLTRFESSLMYAVQVASNPAFNANEEEAKRRAEAEEKYRGALQNKRVNRSMGLAGCNWRQLLDTTDEMLQVARTNVQRVINIASADLEACDSDFDVASERTSDDRIDTKFVPKLHQPSEDTFWKIVSKFGFHWTSHFRPTECRIHDSGPLWVKELEVVTGQAQTVRFELDTIRKDIEARGSGSDLVEARIAEEAASKRSRILQKKLRELQKNVQLYKTHLDQYEACRKVIKEIEEGLDPGEAVMYRDFVAAYNCDGEKLQNLVFVLRWRNSKGQPLQTFKFNNMCDD